MKLAVVWALERLCTLLDRIPWRSGGQWHRHGCLGCYPLRLAYWSSRLEDRWRTGYWGSA